MGLAVTLLLYAAVAGWGLDWLLARWRMLGHFPRTSLYTWHATALGTLTAIITALLILAHDVWEHGLAWLMHADKALIHDVYAGPQEVPAAWNLAFVALLGLLGLLCVLLVRAATHARNQARAHQVLATLSLRGEQPIRESRIGLVDHQAPAIYCVAGRKASARILVTRGAMDRLTQAQLGAAIEHEEAHLRSHHHAMVVLADSLRRLMRPLGLLHNYPIGVRELIELAADDAAARHHGRLTVAAALLEMCSPLDHSASSTLSWTGADAGRRIKRLAEKPSCHRYGRSKLALLVLAAVSLAGLPVATALTPAIRLVGSQHESTVVEDLAPSSTQPSPVFVHHE